MRIQCRNCQSLVDIDDDTPQVDIRCPECQTLLDVSSEETLDYVGAPDSDGAYQAKDREVFGRFVILRSLGAGGYGAVYEALDQRHDRTVVLKLLRARVPAPKRTQRFMREARVCMGLRHPNIVAVHEAGMHDERPFLVAEFVEGDTLRELASRRSISPTEAARICIQILEGLSYAHHRGVVHRDLKPSNIILAGGTPRIVDFGLAKLMGEVVGEEEGMLLGTPAYMSPEQSRGEGWRADGRSDIFSVGIILYELLAGQRPFAETLPACSGQFARKTLEALDTSTARFPGS